MKTDLVIYTYFFTPFLLFVVALPMLCLALTFANSILLLELIFPSLFIESKERKKVKFDKMMEKAEEERTKWL